MWNCAHTDYYWTNFSVSLLFFMLMSTRKVLFFNVKFVLNIITSYNFKTSERASNLIRMAMATYNEKYNKEDYDNNNLRNTPPECKEMFSSFSYNDTSSVEIGEAVNHQTTCM